MRVHKTAVVAALAALACDAGTPAAPGAVAEEPRFVVVGPAGLPDQAAPLRIVNQTDFEEQESFRFCDGTVTWGDITWHEVIVEVEAPEGTVRGHMTYHMIHGGRAYGPDGTEYVVQQVNVGRSVDYDAASPGVSDYRSTIRIMLISRGPEPNALYTDVRWNGGSWSMCRA